MGLFAVSTFNGTAIKKDYLNFHPRICKHFRWQVITDYRGLPEQTLSEIFIDNFLNDKVTWSQLFLPTFMHINPVHLYCSVEPAWRCAEAPVPAQTILAVCMLLGSTAVNWCLWKMGSMTFRSLPVSQQYPRGV